MTPPGAVRRTAMLSSLRVQDFRCFAALDLEAPPQGAILLGDNAQGKTSILEAICVLVRLQSPRTRKFGALTRFATAGFGVAGNPWNQERLVRQTTAGGLALTVDGAARATRNAYLEDGGLIVWMGTEDLGLVRGPGEVRRRYLDFLGSQLEPAYRREWSRYRRALKAKNLLLKDGPSHRPEVISYNEILIESGAFLMAARTRMAAALAPLAAAAQAAISGVAEPLTLHYLPSAGTDLRAAIQQARERESRQRQAVVGPHRDELSLRLHGSPAADFASEGQQRTLALALKLAQGALLERETGRQPIYLMDDVFGELDPARRNALMAHLPGSAQKWITTTSLDWLEDTPALAPLARHRIAKET